MQELSPLTSGRLSHSSGTLNGCLTEENDSPPISPTEDFEDIVKVHFFPSNSSVFHSHKLDFVVYFHFCFFLCFENFGLSPLKDAVS